MAFAGRSVTASGIPDRLRHAPGEYGGWRLLRRHPTSGSGAQRTSAYSAISAV